VSLKYEEVAEILKIIDSSSCDELIVETGDIKLVVRRNSAPGHVAPALAASAPPSVEAAPRARADASASSSATASAAAAAARSSTMEHRPTSGQIEVTAPMVGTFYRAPSPDAPPFVEVGSIVKPGQPLCIIEVMKLFTTINSDCAGRVVQIGADVGELVEYGRTLFVIEPA
jgi:acetyl-CoA carboxylase biotin carboxyl carrier protein